MLKEQFEALVQSLSKLENLPQVLEALKASDNPEVVEAAESLAGQFSLAQVEGEERIYHVTTQYSEENGSSEEFAEWIMNEGDDVIKFIAWFFYVMFDVKDKESYKAAGKTYTQPKKR
jgi:hypothetical protein